MRTSAFSKVLISVLVVSVLAGCSSAPPKESTLMAEVGGVEVTKTQLTALMYYYAYRFASRIELAADEIYTGSSDAAIRRAAIDWRLNAPPEMMRVCFRADPLAGLLGARTFSISMRQFFETGNGKDVFGPYQGLAIATSRQLEDDLWEIIGEVWPTAEESMFAGKPLEMATANPIQNLRFVPEVWDPDLAEHVDKEVTGGLGAAGAMNEQMQALTRRANLLTATLPRQIHWQTAALMEDSRQLVREITDSTLVAVTEHTFSSLDPVFEFADGQRALMVEALARERSAILEAVAEERIAVLASLEHERIQAFVGIADERNATMQGINELTLAALERIGAKSESTIEESIDHVYRRAFQFLALPLVFLGLGFVVMMLWVRNAVNRMLDRLELRRDASV